MFIKQNQAKHCLGVAALIDGAGWIRTTTEGVETARTARATPQADVETKDLLATGFGFLDHFHVRPPPQVLLTRLAGREDVFVSTRRRAFHLFSSTMVPTRMLAAEDAAQSGT